MKFCPICEKRFENESEVCDIDGARLKKSGAEEDKLIGSLMKGRYQVRKKLGAGGMGSVYLADQVSIGRKVALKILHGAYATDEEFIRRFRHEARMAASLNHHNIVTVYDFDQGDDGSLFIAMEYVDGRSLSEIIKREGPLDIGRAVRLGSQIAEGVGAAHAVGVIHRDIKPDNIMVVGIGEKEEVKLMDFGIARLRDTGAMTRLTRSGVLMGTPAYMAPEQIEGGGDVSERTDIYALGLVLYEMLSGGAPFKASTPGTVLVKQLREMPVPLRKLRPEVPAAVERVVMQALEKKPQSRQRDMEEVAQGLRRVGGVLREGQIPRIVLKDQPLSQRIVGQLHAVKAQLLNVGVTNPITVALGIALILLFGGLIGKRAGWWEKLRGITLSSSSSSSAPAERLGGEDNDANNKQIRLHITEAESLRDRGDYSRALAELEKARLIGPTDMTVKAEIEHTKRVCLAEKKLGLTEERCD
jgi:serine/threonine protein kinase